MAIIEGIAAGISILGGGKSAYDWITGNTISRKLNAVDARLQRLDERLYYYAQQELSDPRVGSQNVITNPSAIRHATRPLQSVLDRDLVVSTPILTPKQLRRALRSDPEEILFGITMVTAMGLPSKYLEDPTLLPVTFTKSGSIYIGFLKVGYARDYLGVEYTPQIPLLLKPDKENFGLESDTARRKGISGVPLIHFDGIYQSPIKHGVASSRYSSGPPDSWHYLRFYADGTVLTVSSTGNPSQVIRWFEKGNEDISSGGYILKGTSLKFSSTSTMGTVDYEGVVRPDGSITLTSHSHINGHRGSDRYIFIRGI